jgi:hypothetical protein
LPLRSKAFTYVRVSWSTCHTSTAIVRVGVGFKPVDGERWREQQSVQCRALFRR